MKRKEICKKIIKTVRKSDQFGEQIQFNFDKNGKFHTTTIGGIVTITIITAILYYTVICI